MNADEVFITNSVSGIAPVTQIDIWKIGGGKPGKYGLKFQEIYLNWLKSGRNGTLGKSRFSVGWLFYSFWFHAADTQRGGGKWRSRGIQMDLHSCINH